MPTSAHRLHDLLRDVRAQGQTHMHDAWCAVLGTEQGTPEFVRRHAQTAALLDDTLRDLAALTDRQQARFAQYALAWWRAVVAPDHQWNSSANNAAVDIIGVADLHQLESAADLIEARFPGTTLAPAGDGLERLAEQAREWLDLVKESAEIPAPLAGQLTAQLEHLLWLITNAPLFGSSAVARSADETLGSLARATLTVKDAATATLWRRLLTSYVATVTLLTGGLTATDAMLQAGTGTVESITRGVEAGQNLHDAVTNPEDGSEPPATEPETPPARGQPTA